MQLGRIHVGPDALWLIAAGGLLWWHVERVDLLGVVLGWAAGALAAAGVASIVTWATVSLWRRFRN
jgi:hypothetical protein